MKLYYEIAVDKQTSARDRIFEGVSDSGCPRDSHANIWSIFGPILPNHFNMLKTMNWGDQLVAIHLLNTLILVSSNLDKNWLSYEQSKILFAHIWKYTPNMVDFVP